MGELVYSYQSNSTPLSVNEPRAVSGRQRFQNIVVRDAASDEIVEIRISLIVYILWAEYVLQTE